VSRRCSAIGDPGRGGGILSNPSSLGGGRWDLVENVDKTGASGGNGDGETGRFGMVRWSGRSRTREKERRVYRSMNERYNGGVEVINTFCN
jgi:hypothetical protein